ncbi:MAG: hypothetical protein LBU07_04525 [Coriobacteriales bacterium]|nr:hypothetical protein [Coriobacteriales bacterium]
MDMALAIITGFVGGVIGVTPFWFAYRVMRDQMGTGGLPGIGLGVMAMVTSFILMAIEIVICRLLAATYLLPFSISAIGFFIVAMLVYTATLMRR